jgi:hypothetical protein
VRRLLVRAGVVPISPIPVTLMKEALSSSLTSDLKRATRRNIPDDVILQLVSCCLALSVYTACFIGLLSTLNPQSVCDPHTYRPDVRLFPELLEANPTSDAVKSSSTTIFLIFIEPRSSLTYS